MLLTLLLSEVYIVRANESTKTLTKTLKDAHAYILFFLSLPVQSLCKLVKKRKLARTNIPQTNMAKSKLYTMSVVI